MSRDISVNDVPRHHTTLSADKRAEIASPILRAEAVAGTAIEPVRIAAANTTPRNLIPVPLHAMSECGREEQKILCTERIDQ
jgi:hypothetical protein